MRKNTTLRFSALLLVLALVTSCFVGGTFAKYTTSANDTVSARVANWGFESTNAIVLDDLFSATYESDTSLTTVSPTVNSADGKLLVAPGTTGSVDFQFKYDESAQDAPEVAYRFTVDTTGSSCSIGDGVLIWSLDDEKCGTNGTFNELLADLKALSGDASGIKDYAPGQLPAAFGTTDNVHTISWVWDFDDSGHGTYDDRDTSLGNEDTLRTVTVALKITATQLD